MTASLYLGRVVDPDSLAPTADYALFDPDTLVRHAVCLGMTGSGKTGLCVALLEELAIAGIPILAIDPKGDIANLALAFANHAPKDFEPWIDAAAAKREGRTSAQEAEHLAARWKQGLADWQVDDDRVRAFTQGAKVTIYTPGSTSGTPIDVFGALAAPPDGILDDEEGLQELIGGTTGALLALVGITGDPGQDPPFLVIGRIIDDAWRRGEPLDVATLIPRIVDPPFDKIGVFPLDKFWARADRMKVAMALNALVASPAFAPWTQGVPLDPERFLQPIGDKTPISVFYVAHLDEARRSFFVTQLLERIVAWSRRQSGTSGLRCLVYFDEVYGFLPPYPRNPPTKKPVITLMKQARAVGVGTMLVTQNPVDVDYAALANAGLWLIGRLQTEQDREKVVDGLVGAGAVVDRAAMNKWIAQLPPRVFVLKDAASPAPGLIMSRQTISFLRGPLTKREIEQVSGKTVAPAPALATAAAPPPPGRRPSTATGASAPRSEGPPSGYTPSPPPGPDGYAYGYLDPDAVFSSRLAEHFDAHAIPARSDGRTVWEPALYARLNLQFDEGKEFVLNREEHRMFFPIGSLRAAFEPAFEANDILHAPPGAGWFAPLPANADEQRELKALEKKVVDDVLRGETERMFRHKELRLEGRAGESREDFEARVQFAIDQKADAEIAKLKEKVDRDGKRIEDKRVRLMRELERQKSDAQYRGLQEVASVGEALFGVFFGHRRVTSAVSGAVGKRTMTANASARAGQTEAEIADLEREIYEISNRTEDEVTAIRRKFAPLLQGIDEVAVRLEASDIRLQSFGIVWIPVTRAV